VKCDPPGCKGLSFDVYRVYDYTKLADYRRRKDPATDWEKHFSRVVSAAVVCIR
jgi:hypothetical protein